MAYKENFMTMKFDDKSKFASFILSMIMVSNNVFYSFMIIFIGWHPDDTYYFLHDYIINDGYLAVTACYITVYFLTWALIKWINKRNLQRGFEDVKDLVRGSIIAPPH